jgi:hypothetical protein
LYNTTTKGFAKLRFRIEIVWRYAEKIGEGLVLWKSYVRSVINDEYDALDGGLSKCQVKVILLGLFLFLFRLLQSFTLVCSHRDLRIILDFDWLGRRRYYGVEAISSSSSLRDLVTPAAALFFFRFGFFGFVAGVSEPLASPSSSWKTKFTRCIREQGELRTEEQRAEPWSRRR